MLEYTHTFCIAAVVVRLLLCCRQILMDRRVAWGTSTIPIAAHLCAQLVGCILRSFQLAPDVRFYEIIFRQNTVRPLLT